MNDDQSQVRVRIAPSPTGNLHVGTAHTTIFNYLFARRNQGKFILRIEDTDLERSDKKFEEDIIAGLKWLGIIWDEGPMQDGSEKGEHGPYRQTKRNVIYQKYLQLLLKEGKAFYCFHTEEDLETERKEQLATKTVLMHVCKDWRDFPLEDAEKKLKFGNNAIIRFKMPQESPETPSNYQVSFTDLIRNQQIHFFARLLGDFSLAKSLELPLYNFAVVVDDYEMKITHVIRGDDHIPNTSKQVLIAKALGWTIKDEIGNDVPPWKYAHLPLLLGSDRSKLSKRHGATSISQYRSEGYLPYAIFNYLALLGWNPGTDQEIFSLEELIKEFSLEKVQKAGAIFDITKLDWMNGEYIRKKSTAELRELACPYLTKFSQDKNEYIEQILTLERPRLKKFSELPEKIDYFFIEPKYDKSLLIWKSMSNEDVKNSLINAQKIIETISEDNWNKEYIETIFLAEGKNYQNRGELLWPLRVAISGKKASPGPFDILTILGQETAIKRIQKAISML
ncbi:MAG: glutamate--tRNA ligase [Patescibacteria group bacterium]